MNNQSAEAVKISNPLIPMGALTGKPTREQLRNTLTKYREAGFDQYLIYPRSGCELEYLSEEYLDTVAVICEEAEKLEFSSLWLYDEFNWPSGSCFSRVPTENPDFAMRFIAAYRDKNEIKTGIRCNPTYSNLMDPAAVDRFIELTHQRYYERLKPWFGTLIKGIFTDEPEIGHFGDNAADTLFCMGYYDGLEDDYRNLTGGDLFADIAAGVRGNPDYYPTVCAKLLGERFKTCFIDRVQAWCAQRNIVLTGHLMNETLPVKGRKSNGRILPVLSGMGLPGMDDIRCDATLNGFDFTTYGTALYAVEKQRSGGLAELFAVCKTDIPFAELTPILYLAAAFGIDHYVLAVAALDPRGNAIKTNYYNSFAADVPQLPAFKSWGETARHAASLASVPRRYEAAVRYTDNAATLPFLLRDLTDAQISWCLVTPEETVPEDIPFVFVQSADGIFEERTGGRAPSFAGMRKRLREKLQLDSEIRTHEDIPACEVFVRRYCDGRVLVVDMSGRNRRLKFCRNGGTLEFELPAFGVQEFPGWQMKFDLPHTLRLEFDPANTASVELFNSQQLKIALRSYQGTGSIAINGNVITAEDECTGLPESFQKLYREADLGTLSAGKYVFALDEAIQDHPFLPSAILLGEELPSYTGRVTQSATLLLPATALKIKLSGTLPPPGDAEMRLNSKSLGWRLGKPYEWVIPEALRGAVVELELEYSSSLSALFGNPMRGSDALSSALRGLFVADYRGKLPPIEVDFI